MRCDDLSLNRILSRFIGMKRMKIGNVLDVCSYSEMFVSDREEELKKSSKKKKKNSMVYNIDSKAETYIQNEIQLYFR